MSTLSSRLVIAPYLVEYTHQRMVRIKPTGNPGARQAVRLVMKSNGAPSLSGSGVLGVGA
jgi:hypothetical protein